MASGPIVLSQVKQLAEPVMNDNFSGIYEQRTKEWVDIFTKKEGMKRSSHNESILSGFDNAAILADGAPVQYDIAQMLFMVSYPYDRIALGFGVTEDTLEDTDWMDLMSKLSAHLSQSLYETEETLAANILNYGFNPGYTQSGGDGVSLFSNNHLMANGGVFSNEGVAAALSMTSLEALTIQISQAVDARGKKIRLDPQHLVVPPALRYQAAVVLKSILNPDATTASNAINAINSENVIKKGYKIITRLTSNDAWFVHNELNAKEDFGLVRLNRSNLKKRIHEDNNTNTLNVTATERYRFGWLDPRGIYGNNGVGS